MNFKQLRDKHPEFIYNGFEINYKGSDLKVSFDFQISPDIKFKPEITFPSPKIKDKQILNTLVFNLGMVELLSYWKAACSPIIIVRAGFLNEDQIKFWKNLFIKGLGEFFYNNKIDFTKTDLVKFKIDSKAPKFSKIDIQLKDRDLVLIGGGKDSAVTLEIMSQSDREFSPLTLNPTTAAKNISEIDDCCIIPITTLRSLDPKLLELNKKGYLNGHTPFSAYLGFLSTLAAVVYDFKNIIVSNEASSNEGNTKWKTEEINHQYSKSFEFENLFRDYSKKYLTTQTNYFSFLRPLGEVQISQLFSKMHKYHKLFRSCNRGSKKGVWCGECPKCVSTYLTLYPFLGSRTKEIFKKDLLEDKKLIPIVKGLLRENNVVKPFECVATVEEMKVAIFLAIERAKKDKFKIPQVLKAVSSKALGKEILNEWNNKNNLNKYYLNLLKNKLKEFKTKKILILGFGREGKTTLSFLKKHFPAEEVSIADMKDGENYLDKIKDADIVIKSPGIPYLPEIKRAQRDGKTITSATKIFFENFKGRIIGVTGTKGKSTTASLIYEVLKKGGLDVYLLGNIGHPALELLDKLSEHSIVVYELSSFQLEDLNLSPHIAVITNIYPEHLDHHGSLENYIKAKANIIRFQKADDYLIYNEGNSTVRRLANLSKAKNKYAYTNNSGLDNTAPVIYIGRNIFNLPEEKSAETIKNFKPLPHRLEFIGKFKKIKFYNDSLSTIPQATIAALGVLGEKVETLIAGGFDRGIDYSILGPVIAKSSVKNLILFPTTGEKIWQALRNQKHNINKYEVSNMKQAVKLAYIHTSPGKTVLLSPASTSFNLFKDYEDRGNQFKKNIKKFSGLD